MITGTASVPTDRSVSFHDYSISTYGQTTFHFTSLFKATCGQTLCHFRNCLEQITRLVVREAMEGLHEWWVKMVPKADPFDFKQLITVLVRSQGGREPPLGNKNNNKSFMSDLTPYFVRKMVKNNNKRTYLNSQTKSPAVSQSTILFDYLVNVLQDAAKPRRPLNNTIDPSEAGYFPIQSKVLSISHFVCFRRRFTNNVQLSDCYGQRGSEISTS